MPIRCEDLAHRPAKFGVEYIFAFTPWRKMKRKQRLSGGARSYHGIIILTLNNLSRIKSRLGQVEELVCSRMKHSRLYVILLHLVLSAKSVYNF